LIRTNGCGIVRISWISKLKGLWRDDQRPGQPKPWSNRSGDFLANPSGLQKEIFVEREILRTQRSWEDEILSRRDPGKVIFSNFEFDDTHENLNMVSFNLHVSVFLGRTPRRRESLLSLFLKIRQAPQNLEAASRAPGRSWRSNAMSVCMAGRRPSTSQEHHSLRH